MKKMKNKLKLINDFIFIFYRKLNNSKYVNLKLIYIFSKT